jgi:hypothetical protein
MSDLRYSADQLDWLWLHERYVKVTDAGVALFA